MFVTLEQNTFTKSNKGDVVHSCVFIVVLMLNHAFYLEISHRKSTVIIVVAIDVLIPGVFSQSNSFTETRIFNYIIVSKY